MASKIVFYGEQNLAGQFFIDRFLWRVFYRSNQAEPGETRSNTNTVRKKN